MSEFGMDLVDTQIHGQGLPGNGQETVHVSLDGGNTDIVLSGDIEITHTDIAKILHDLIHGKIGVLEGREAERIVF